MVKGLVSKIQHYSTKDGPGIRTTVFMMGCNLRCKWCANPENLRHKPQVFYFKERCKHCGLCVQYAKNHSIVFGEVGCIINRETCDNLVDMVDLCPYDAYEMIGKEYTVDELVKVLLKDKEFYESSGGGVTFSGGEAALQKDFIVAVAKRLKEHNIHVCLDTAGLIPLENMKELLDVVDLVLFDIKAMDSSMHLHCTEVSNETILENFKMIHIPTIVRMVIVPTYNDALDDIKKRIDFISQYGKCVLQVDVLKYHIFGIGKYEKLGMDYPIVEKLENDDSLIDEIISYGNSSGLKMTIGG